MVMQYDFDGHPRRCEAYVETYTGRFVACGQTPVQNHHRLTRARGGIFLDDVGETYHLMDLCATHHQMAEDGDARAGGLLLAGSVAWCTVCDMPRYTGPDVYLTENYGEQAHSHDE